MKKWIALFLVCVLGLGLLTGCGGGDKTTSTDVNTSGANTSTNVKSRTLEEIKKDAKDAGYEVVENASTMGATDAVAAINVVYVSTYIPVMEFKTAHAASAYAKYVNGGGYNQAIVGGKILTFTEVSHGIVVDDAEKAFLEGLIGGKAVEIVATPGPLADSYKKDYAGAYSLAQAIRKAMDDLTGNLLARYNKEHPEGDPKNANNFIATVDLLGSMGLAFTATLSEDQAVIDALPTAMASLGCTDVKVVRGAANDYTISYKSFGTGETKELRAVYDPATGAMRMTEATNGAADSFYEFVPLGGDAYAYRTPRECAYVVYKDGAIQRFAYSSLARDEASYAADNGGIYPSGGSATEAWVCEKSAEMYYAVFTYDGTALSISTRDFGGKPVQLTIAK